MTYLANNLPSNEATTSFTQRWQQSFENFFYSLETIFCNSNTQEFDNKNKITPVIFTGEKIGSIPSETIPVSGDLF